LAIKAKVHLNIYDYSAVVSLEKCRQTLPSVFTCE